MLRAANDVDEKYQQSLCADVMRLRGNTSGAISPPTEEDTELAQGHAAAA